MSLNLVTMNPTEAREALGIFYRMNQPVMFHGDAGAGKTSMVRDFCANATSLIGHPLGLVTWNLSMMDDLAQTGKLSPSRAGRPERHFVS